MEPQALDQNHGNPLEMWGRSPRIWFHLKFTFCLGSSEKKWKQFLTMGPTNMHDLSISALKDPPDCDFTWSGLSQNTLLSLNQSCLSPQAQSRGTRAQYQLRKIPQNIVSPVVDQSRTSFWPESKAVWIYEFSRGETKHNFNQGGPHKSYLIWGKSPRMWFYPMWTFLENTPGQNGQSRLMECQLGYQNKPQQRIMVHSREGDQWFFLHTVKTALWENIINLWIHQFMNQPLGS